jgi:hypothetical protein
MSITEINVSSLLCLCGETEGLFPIRCSVACVTVTNKSVTHSLMLQKTPSIIN